MSFTRFVLKHDPNGRTDWTWPWRLNSGESLVSGTVEVVDSTGSTVDAATDLVIESASYGQISGTLWGVTAWISGGTPGDYYLRCRVETDSDPISRKADRTMKLIVAEL